MMSDEDEKGPLIFASDDVSEIRERMGRIRDVLLDQGNNMRGMMSDDKADDRLGFSREGCVKVDRRAPEAPGGMMGDEKKPEEYAGPFGGTIDDDRPIGWQEFEICQLRANLYKANARISEVERIVEKFVDVMMERLAKP